MTRTVSISKRQWSVLVRQLARRGQRRRESGAFLLGRLSDRPTSTHVAWPVSDVTYFDDLDADCLTGGITFTRFDALWEVCRARRATVIADVHTHPGDWVEQSQIDSSNPMISSLDHVAIILPNYANGRPKPTDSGVYRHLGGKNWAADHASFEVREGVLGRLRRWIRGSK